MKIVAMAAPLPTYYDVLQVARDASAGEVRMAYRKLAQKYHPDKMPGNANAARAMAAINAAYEVLSDTHRRSEHDVWIRRAESVSRPAPAVPRGPQNLWAILHPSASWPWYLLFSTVIGALGTVATTVYLSTMPARAATVPAADCAVATVPAAPACARRS